jgi:hypothetical protein
MKTSTTSFSVRHAPILSLVVLLFVLSMPERASADPPIIVGNGAVDSCVEGAEDMPGSLRWAVSVASALGGGVIRFDCGKSPVTITLHPVGALDLELPDHTTIDGDGLITLAHEPVLCCPPNINEVMFSIRADATVTMKDITIRGRTNPIRFPVV